MNRKHWVFIAVCAVAAVLVGVFPESAAACPNCKEALEQDPQYQGMITGYFYSILLMMSMPFVILGSLTMYMLHVVKREAAKKSALAAVAGTDPPL